MSRLIELGNADVRLIDGDRGSNYPSKDEFYDTEYCLFLDAGNITEYGFDFSSTHFITKEKDEQLKNGKLHRNDIVMMTRGSVGNIALYDESIPYENVRINSGMIIIRCIHDYDVLPIYYMLKSDFVKKQIRDLMSGSVQKQLPASVIRSIKIIKQNIRKQIEIIYFIEKKIRSNNATNYALQMMAKTIYDYWFLQFDFPNEDGKPYKSSGGKMVRNEELGWEIPEGWRVGILKELATITMGSSPKGESLNEDGNGIIFYQGKADFGYRFPMVRMYTNSPIRYAEVNDILLSVRAPVGSINIVDQRCCIGRGLAALHCSYQSFLYYFMLSNQYQFDKFNNSGTTFGAITRDELFDLRVVIPDEAVIRLFEERVKPIDWEIANNEKQNKELMELRDYLLPLLMNGQVRFG